MECFVNRIYSISVRVYLDRIEELDYSCIIQLIGREGWNIGFGRWTRFFQVFHWPFSNWSAPENVVTVLPFLNVMPWIFY